MLFCYENNFQSDHQGEKVGKSTVPTAVSIKVSSLIEIEIASPLLSLVLFVDGSLTLNSVFAGIDSVKKFDRTSSFPVFVQMYFLPLYLNLQTSLKIKLSVKVI